MNRELLTAYLLHEMPEEERWAFSEQWLEEPGLHAELLAVEAELLDEYVRGDASVPRRAQIEEWLLVGEGQEAKLQFAKALHRRFRRSLPSRLKLSWWLAAAAVLISWIAVRGSMHKEVRKRPEVVAALQEKRNVFTVPLAENDLRGAPKGGVAIAIPPGTELVRLDLDLDRADESASTSVEVTGPGRLAWKQSNVLEERREGRDVASVWIPSSILKSGDYEVKLLVNGKGIAYYGLSIRIAGKE